jgi:hypothetical protein
MDQWQANPIIPPIDIALSFSIVKLNGTDRGRIPTRLIIINEKIVDFVIGVIRCFMISMHFF